MGKILNSISRFFGGGKVRRDLTARYDAAQTNDNNRRHWANADALSADAAADVGVRRLLRMRSRYEVANNCYARGLVHAIANYTIGTGPRIQFQTASTDDNRKAEDAFNRWAKEIGLARLLRTARISKAESGEVFGHFISNGRLAEMGLPSLDIKLLEADQVATPTQLLGVFNVIDGIVFDNDDNPVSYTVLNRHPGDTRWSADFLGFTVVSAENMFHMFRRERPGQHRGIPEITAALPIFAKLRRYKDAVLDAAETAARFSMFCGTDSPAGGESAEVDPMTTMEVVPNQAVFLPEGWKPFQMKAEHPTAEFNQTVVSYLSEIGRVLQIPVMIVTGDASDHNFASGRLDYQAFLRFIDVDRSEVVSDALHAIVEAWRREAALIDGYLPQSFRTNDPVPHTWFWDGLEGIDELKSANAQQVRLSAGTTSYAIEFAKSGRDWEAMHAQAAKEYGVSLDEYRAALFKKNFESGSQKLPADPSSDTPDNPQNTDPMMIKRRVNRVADAELILNADNKGELLAIAAPVAIEAAAKDAKADAPRKFSFLAYSGGILEVGWGTPVVLDLAGLTFDQTTPIMQLHGRTVDDVLGQTTKVELTADGLKAEGNVLAASDNAQKILKLADAGYQWQASVGVNVTRREFVPANNTTNVNGKTFAGPLIVARAGRLREISVVPIGADAAAKTLVATNQENDMDFESWLKAKGFDAATLSAAQRTTLEAAWKAEQATANNAGNAGGNGNGGSKAANAAAKPDNGNAGSLNAAGATDLDAILAAGLARKQRRDRITQLTAKAIEEHPEMVDLIGKLATAAIEADQKPEDFEMSVIRLSRNTPTISHIRRDGNSEITADVYEAAICVAAGLGGVDKCFNEQTLVAANRRWRHGLTLGELLLEASERNGNYRPRSLRGNIEDALRAAFNRGGDMRTMNAALSTIDVSGILSNVANKFVKEAWNAVESTWREISAVRPVNDFKAITTYSLVADAQYEEVGPDGELKHGSLSEVGYSNQAKTFGKLFGLDRRDIINDDMGVFNTMGRRLGRGGALKLNDVFWSVFMNNSSFFSTGNSNYDDGTDTALSIAALELANTLFLNQTGPDGKPAGITPKILLTPNALAVTAMKLTKDLEIRDTTSSTQYTTGNPWAGMFRPVKSSYLSNTSYTGYSTKKWYLLADPNDVPVIETVFLNGRAEPTVESADADFDTLGVQFRGYHDFGCALQEKRGGVAMKGEN